MKKQPVMERRREIMKKSLGIDYKQFESGSIAFDYEAMMAQAGYPLDEVRQIQQRAGVGNTPLIELKNLSTLSRSLSPKGKGARIFIKDEASNPSGSFKARRASVSIHHAAKMGFQCVAAATSGNYGAAVASQAAMKGLDCIIVQECYDSQGKGQPEIIEKARKCEAFGAEVIQLSVGPELFAVFLEILEETGAFNASLYTPFGIAGVETLGWEIAQQCQRTLGRFPDAVVATNAGGGNLTGTARGLRAAGATQTQIIGASVNLTGLHMASDQHFNRKSFTTGHTGFGMPFATWPDRSDVPRSAGRPLRYMDRYLTVAQGEVFWATEALARLEGLERGPAGNTSLAAALGMAREMDEDAILVVQETEYTGAGKHVAPQLSFARENGIQIRIGNPREEVPGESIILPSSMSQILPQDADLAAMSRSLIRRAVAGKERASITSEDRQFLAAETRQDEAFVTKVLEEVL
ncbi:MAG: PLP-dependent lyase/thiolase [Spirochaetales bacterium]|nr:PLP-dependent lyase/thiolase [Spirochaetales bacterium]